MRLDADLVVGAGELAGLRVGIAVRGAEHGGCVGFGGGAGVGCWWIYRIGAAGLERRQAEGLPPCVPCLGDCR